MPKNKVEPRLDRPIIRTIFLFYLEVFMVKVTLKDGSVKEVESGKLIIELARDLSQSLAK